MVLSGHSGTTTSVLELLYIRPEQVSRYLHYLNITIYTIFTISTLSTLSTLSTGRGVQLPRREQGRGGGGHQDLGGAGLRGRGGAARQVTA